jgi:hypothetical protein
MHLSTFRTVLLLFQSEIHVDGVLCIKKLVSFMKQGTAVKTATWTYVLRPIFKVIIPWSITERMEVECGRVK